MSKFSYLVIQLVSQLVGQLVELAELVFQSVSQFVCQLDIYFVSELVELTG